MLYHRQIGYTARSLCEIVEHIVPNYIEIWLDISPWRAFWKLLQIMLPHKAVCCNCKNVPWWLVIFKKSSTLERSHNEPDGVSNHRFYGYLLCRLFRPTSHKNIKVPRRSPITAPPHKGQVTRKMFAFEEVIKNNFAVVLGNKKSYIQ